jgi:hypothetical protein
MNNKTGEKLHFELTTGTRDDSRTYEQNMKQN